MLLLTVILVLLGIGLSFYGYWRIEKKIRQHQTFINQALAQIEEADSQIVAKTSEGLEKILLGVDSQTAILSGLSENIEGQAVSLSDWSESLKKIHLTVEGQTTMLSDLSERLETFASKTLAREFFDGNLPYPEGLMNELRDIGVDLKQAREQAQSKQALANEIMYGSHMRELPVEKRK